MADKVIFLTSGNTWTVPTDWNSSANSIECIGGGASGNTSSGGNNAAGGGGGGAYSKILNITLTINDSISYTIGSGGSG